MPEKGSFIVEKDLKISEKWGERGREKWDGQEAYEGAVWSRAKERSVVQRISGAPHTGN